MTSRPNNSARTLAAVLALAAIGLGSPLLPAADGPGARQSARVENAKEATLPVAEPRRDIETEMRDGLVLLGDLWTTPGADEPLPIILIRTPYGRQLEEHRAKNWAKLGYGVFVQAVRGRDGSDGTWIPWENELDDGFDTIDWMAKQEWCNGRIGMMGGSYLGHVQILAAATGHPALKCVVPLSPGSDGFSDVPFGGGILKPGLISWLYSCRNPVLDVSREYPATATDRNLARLPIAEVDQAWAGFRSHIWRHWVGIETIRDMPGLIVWDRLERARHKTPAFHIGGIWDHESGATRRNWEQFSMHGGPDQYFMLGPWPHEPNQFTRYADVEYGEHAVIDLDGLRRRWYEHWLHDDQRSELDMPRVQVFATGANRWLHLDRWPARDAAPVSWHISSDSSRDRRAFAEALSPGAPSESVTWDWEYDPSQPVNHARDESFYRSTRLWFANDDPDALVLATPRFDQDTLLTGPVELELAIESSAADTDLYAILVEVSPSGTARALHRQAPIRARFRNGFDRIEPLVPGEANRVVWPLNDFAHVFPKGSRLGLAIRSEWFPDCARNLGTLESMKTATKCVVQRNRIHSGPGHVSELRLHKVPIDRLQEE